MTDQSDFPQQHNPADDETEMVVTAQGILDREGMVKAQARRELRKSISTSEIGDSLSREGKIKDVLDITAVHLLVEIVVCGEHPSNDADRMRFAMLQELSGGTDILAYAKDRLVKIKAGEILLSAPAKPGGVTGALDEAFDASTAFVKILMGARGA